MITSDPEDIKKATKIVLPGVGAFSTGMEKLNEMNLIQLLNRKVLEEKVPVLGICLGMQIMCKTSEEGVGPGLGWVNADVKKFQFPLEDTLHKVPHIGWNYMVSKKEHPIVSGFDQKTRFYFVHSYYVKCNEQADVLAQTEYGIEFDSMFAVDNIIGAQFHPEKSHRFGMDLLKRFAEI
ncbi:imidazole glycerol phosphate synthase subunit HisH [Bdellovibrio bacteriovorus str. Tiberius]|uniref:Imidazole glycerol phosphate synthase subunit HisH n=1 Tax=Bdellovibrio bacteriovorus str. Tiberius TaxID=1069642 RepID=K7YUQ3_BDEBC|nr:imidazole glycerol phosphate synthase subunit HisH [Bdellovibrio bacteriovorus str. Tiberius]